MAQIKLHDCCNHLEKVMLTLPIEKTKNDHSHYLAGMIDCFFELGVISEEERENLYVEYVVFE